VDGSQDMGIAASLVSHAYSIRSCLAESIYGEPAAEYRCLLVDQPFSRPPSPLTDGGDGKVSEGRNGAVGL
jgi:hypothetical protein